MNRQDAKNAKRNRGQTVPGWVEVRRVCKQETSRERCGETAGQSVSRLTVSRAYEDQQNILTQADNSVDSTILSQYAYGNDAGGRRE